MARFVEHIIRFVWMQNSILILPKLDYCSQLWNPSQAGLIQQLELAQKSFLRRINECKNRITKNYQHILTRKKT